MQYASFSEGREGYVLHKVTGRWSGHCSAWYAADGTLKDAEQITRTWARITRPVKVGGPMWRELQRIGKHYASNPAAHVVERIVAARVVVS